VIDAHLLHTNLGGASSRCPILPFYPRGPDLVSKCSTPNLRPLRDEDRGIDDCFESASEVVSRLDAAYDGSPSNSESAQLAMRLQYPVEPPWSSGHVTTVASDWAVSYVCIMNASSNIRTQC
jgi:hypothetical protein